MGPPSFAATLDLSTGMPARVYLWKGTTPFRLAPVDAVLPIKTDLFYRDRLWTASADPKVLEVVASDEYHYFLLKGGGTFHLPPGKYRVEAYRGHFFTPATAEFELKPGEKRALQLELKPWAERQEWISSDDHIHLTRSRKEDPVFLGWLEAEDLTVGNFLQLQRQMDAAPQYGFGRSGEARRSGYSIRPGQESRNEFWGHINMLGASELIRPMSTGLMYANTVESYPFTSQLFAQGKKLGATVGYAHWFEAPQHSTIYMDAALGNIDFIEVFQFGVLKTGPWYELLNAGLRATGIAGSDFPVPLNRRTPWPRWLPLLGPERALVKARAGENSYESWARGVREGNVAVTNGPLVEMTVDEKTGRVEAKAGFFRPLEAVEVVRNGEVVARTAGDGSAMRLTASAEIARGESCWVAARVKARKLEGEPDIQAHTNPDFLLADGKPVRVEAARRAVREKWARQLEFYRGADIRFPDEAGKREFFRTAEEALGRLQ